MSRSPLLPLVTRLIIAALVLKFVLNFVCKQGGLINSKIDWKIPAHDINYKNVNSSSLKSKSIPFIVIQAKNLQYNPSLLKGLPISMENLPNKVEMNIINAKDKVPIECFCSVQLAFSQPVKQESVQYSKTNLCKNVRY